MEADLLRNMLEHLCVWHCDHCKDRYEAKASRKSSIQTGNYGVHTLGPRPKKTKKQIDAEKKLTQQFPDGNCCSCDHRCDHEHDSYYLEVTVKDVHIRIMPLTDEVWDRRFVNEQSYFHWLKKTTNTTLNSASNTLGSAVDTLSSVRTTLGGSLRGKISLHPGGFITGLDPMQPTNFLGKMLQKMLGFFGIQSMDALLVKDINFLDQLREHYGDATAMYFALVGCLSLLLFPVALFGVVMWLVTTRVFFSHDSYLVCLATYASLVTWVSKNAVHKLQLAHCANRARNIARCVPISRVLTVIDPRAGVGPYVHNPMGAQEEHPAAVLGHRPVQAQPVTKQGSDRAATAFHTSSVALIVALRVHAK